MSIDPEKKLNKYGMGKYLLRKAFEGDWLPEGRQNQESKWSASSHPAPSVVCQHPGGGKYLLRKAFEGDWLPEGILWREKTAFSDAGGHSPAVDITLPHTPGNELAILAAKIKNQNGLHRHTPLSP